MTLSQLDLELPALPRRESTAEAVAAVLRSEIAQGRLLPGTQLREEGIAAALEVSRNTVREAFRLLSHERLVAHALHRGVFVRVVGAAEIRALYRTRRLVEPLGLRAAVADPGTLRTLRELADKAASSAVAGDWDAVGTFDIEFHRRLVAACDSVHLSTMFEGLLAELRLAFLRLPDRQALHEPFLRRNQALLDLLEASDVEGSLRAMEDYLIDAETHLLAAATSA
jgi:DNA-binding GntR family transcriptional regulator